MHMHIYSMYVYIYVYICIRLPEAYRHVSEVRIGDFERVPGWGWCLREKERETERCIHYAYMAVFAHWRSISWVCF